MKARDFSTPMLFSATVGIGYALCAAVFALFPGAAASFMTALFHGMDFRPLQVAQGFDLGSFVYALVVLMGWAFMLGVVFNALSSAFERRNG